MSYNPTPADRDKISIMIENGAYIGHVRNAFAFYATFGIINDKVRLMAWEREREEYYQALESEFLRQLAIAETEDDEDGWPYR